MQKKTAFGKFPKAVFLFAQFLVSLVGSLYTVHDCAAEGSFLQYIHTRDGAAAGGADIVFQFAGMLAGLQQHFACTG